MISDQIFKKKVDTQKILDMIFIPRKGIWTRPGEEAVPWTQTLNAYMYLGFLALKS